MGKETNQHIRDMRDLVEREFRHLPQVKSSSAARPPGTGGFMFIAKVDSNATGGGYYNCTLQILDATDWDQTTIDQLGNTGSSIVVLNLPEIPETGATNIHNLIVGSLILCFKIKDDEGNVRYVGNEIFGKHTFGETA